jgi:2-methylisocitrate lyase-like PEP mutase family enzyme
VVCDSPAMSDLTQRARAQEFLRLHDGPGVLVVGSAWDAGSAVLFEREGFAAIATSSAGVAFSLGWPDGERIPRDEMLAAVARIVRATRLPVSADVEMGYARTAREVGETCRGVLAAGAIGVNLEDASGDPARPLVDPARHVEAIRAAREAADAFGVHLVVNARTDGFLLRAGDEASRLADAVRRANRYREAGADCLFVPGVVDRDTIARLAREIAGPLNVLAAAGTPPVAELAALGVRRLSQGSGPARAALSTVRRVARELHAGGTYEAFTTDAIPYAEANRLFEREPS